MKKFPVISDYSPPLFYNLMQEQVCPLSNW